MLKWENLIKREFESSGKILCQNARIEVIDGHLRSVQLGA